MPPVTVVRNEHLDRRTKAKSYYNKTASKELAPLVPGQFVYSKPNDYHWGERWNFGEVLNEVRPHSYLNKTPEGLVDGIEPTKDLLRLRFHVISNLTQQAMPAVRQQEVPTSDSPVVSLPTPVEAVPTSDCSVGSTPSPVERPI